MRYEDFVTFMQVSKKCKDSVNELKTNTGYFVKQKDDDVEMSCILYQKELKLFSNAHTIKIFPQAFNEIQNIQQLIKDKLLALYYVTKQTLNLVNQYDSSIRYLYLSNCDECITEINWGNLSQLQTLHLNHCDLPEVVTNSLVKYQYFHKLVYIATQTEIKGSMQQLNRLKKNNIKTIVICRLIQWDENIDQSIVHVVDGVECNVMMKRIVDYSKIPNNWIVVGWDRISFMPTSFITTIDSERVAKQIQPYELKIIKIDGRLTTPQLLDLKLHPIDVPFFFFRCITLNTVHFSQTVTRLKIECSTIRTLDLEELNLEEFIAFDLKCNVLKFPKTIDMIQLNNVFVVGQLVISNCTSLVSILSCAASSLHINSCGSLFLQKSSFQHELNLSSCKILTMAMETVACPTVYLPLTLTTDKGIDLNTIHIANLESLKSLPKTSLKKLKKSYSKNISFN